ncbi:sodium:proton antiporter, partial [Micromonospora sp. NPDC051141]
GDEVFHLVALTIVISILAHSSTDVVVARAFDESRETPAWHGVLRRIGQARRSAAGPPLRAEGPDGGSRAAPVTGAGSHGTGPDGPAEPR